MVSAFKIPGSTGLIYFNCDQQFILNCLTAAFHSPSRELSMTLDLHIGTEKTGRTYIQNFLRQIHENLMEQTYFVQVRLDVECHMSDIEIRGLTGPAR